MCHHRESSPEWEALVEKELRTEDEASEGATEPDVQVEEESPDQVEPRTADD